MSSVDVTFTEPIDLATFTSADLTLTDNGRPNVITSAVKINLVSGSTYQIDGLAGLTGSEGTYTLSVNASAVQGTAGGAGTGSLSTSWLMDTTPPTSSVNPLPSLTTLTSFLVTAAGTDPSGAGGSMPSGIASFAIYVSADGGPFTLFATVTPYVPSAVFVGTPGDTYGFYSVAKDEAGNVQPTPTEAQATTEVAPNAPPPQPAAPMLAPADDSGTKGDGITDDASPSLIGTTQANATVQLRNGANTVVATTTADGSGDYVFLVPGAPLSPGVYTFTVVASNAIGSSPASNPFTLRIVAPPATPAAPTLQGGGNTTTSPRPILTGTTIPGATVQLFGASGPALNTVKASNTGKYTIPVTGPLSIGPHAYKVDIIDQYGDVSSQSPTLTIREIVTVTNVVKSTNKKGQVTAVTITFSGPVNTTEAGSIASYHLATPGKGGSYTAKNAGTIRLKSAAYNSSNPHGRPRTHQAVCAEQARAARGLRHLTQRPQRHRRPVHQRREKLGRDPVQERHDDRRGRPAAKEQAADPDRGDRRCTPQPRCLGGCESLPSTRGASTTGQFARRSERIGGETDHAKRPR